MTLQKGAKLGPYEIQQLIGAGGMGEVYRALDTRLKRTVAIKTIPAVFRTRAIEYFFGLRSDYAPSKDGQRFLVQTGEPQTQSISVITGWRNSLP